MQLHELRTRSSGPRRQRIGRGGKRGSYSGRGIKGQKSRAGRRMRPGLRELVLRIPKQRGFKNKQLSDKAFVLNLRDLSKIKVGAGKGPVALNPVRLKELGMLSKRFNGRVKLLGQGEIDFAVSVSGLDVSASAKAKIEKAGGRLAGEK